MLDGGDDNDCRYFTILDENIHLLVSFLILLGILVLSVALFLSCLSSSTDVSLLLSCDCVSLLLAEIVVHELH